MKKINFIYEGNLERYKHLIECYKIQNYNFINIDSDFSIDTQQNYFHFIFDGWPVLQFKHNEFSISEKLKNLLVSNKNMFLCFITEHETDSPYSLTYLSEFCQLNSIKENQIFVINGNEFLPILKENQKSNINVYVVNRLQKVSTHNMDLFNFETLDDRLFLFQSYNNRFKKHRIAIISKLIGSGLIDSVDWSLNYLDESIISDKNIDVEFLRNEIDIDKDILNGLKFIAKNGIRKSEMESYDIHAQGSDGVDFNIPYRENPYKHSYINIVTESQFETNDLIHITEKSLIPFFYHQIPIIISTPNLIKFMKNKYNLDFYEDIIDHSYDGEYNSKKRFKMIFDEIRRLSDKKDEIKEYYLKNKQRFESNQNIIRNIKDEIQDEVFFNSLIDFYVE
jgi:hypothetical protein